MAPKDGNPLGFREYIARRFLAEKHIYIYRFIHNYDEDKLGLVYMAGDSTINPGYEVWALMGYNAGTTPPTRDNGPS